MRHYFIPTASWWGPPRQFTPRMGERRVSWLELFYDLVYVIVISRVTHKLSAHLTTSGFIDYAYLVAITFWGWYNGSSYHDLHGTPGIRTRFTTLWQVLCVAALAVTLNSPPAELLLRTTVALGLLQLYITYLWWSVGFYDPAHRRASRPYIVCLLLSLGLLGVVLFVPPAYRRAVYWLGLGLNFLPQFLMQTSRNKAQMHIDQFQLSASMSERLGLLVIIVFGEVMLAVVDGSSAHAYPTLADWGCFGLGILLVFGLWWVFNSLLADFRARVGFTAGQTLALLYLPTVASLLMVGAGIHNLLTHPAAGQTGRMAHNLLGISVALFLVSLVALTYFVAFPATARLAVVRVRPVIGLVAGLVVAATLLPLPLSSLGYLATLTALLLGLVVYLARTWPEVDKDADLQEVAA